MLKISDSDISFEAVYNSDYIPNTEEIKNSNLLILPYHNFREGVEYCFSEYASEVLQYIKENGSKDVTADIAISDDKYQAIEMHSVLLALGIFLTTSVVLPITVNILSSYIYDKVKAMHKSQEEVNVRLKLISQSKNGKSKSIEYDGPASKFSDVIDAVKKLEDEN